MFLSLLEPGDIVLANRGFTVSEDIALQSAFKFHFLAISEKLKADWPKDTLVLKHKCCCVRWTISLGLDPEKRHQ